MTRTELDRGATCGTYAGYQTHTRRGEPHCVECRAANRDYMAEYRAANPAVQTRADRRQKARNRALVRLAARHRAELDALVAEELRRVTR